MIGRTLSHYKVLEKIGEGGMGEVYLAKDTKLDREVAIKVLPPAFSENKERSARFEREAKLLASLNHPNIAAIHELEESDGVHFLALEYVPGETLAERIKRGPIPIDDALPLFKQIAEGLEAAHEKGVIHRDLKPANIKVTPEGKVKVLDFGLAKAMAGDTPVQGLSESPTITREHTEAGVLLGTAPYMSPEQARGKPVDKRTDVWAFGCCLYEALTGKAAYLGETVTDTIAKIVEREPDWDALPATTPALLRRLLRRCLHKDSTHRLHDIADARIEIEEALTEPIEEVVTSQAAPFKSPRMRFWGLVVLFTGVLAGALVVWLATRPGPPPPHSPQRLNIHLPRFPRMRLIDRTTGPSAPILSPDGNRVVFGGYSSDGATGLYMRQLDGLEVTPIPGTDQGYNPFFSPDGQWLGFASGADDKLKKVSVHGGEPLVICDVEMLRGASWGADGTIIFAAGGEGLSRVSSEGGAPLVVTTPDASRNESNHRWPQILPGGQAVIFSTMTRSQRAEERTVAVVSLETGERRVLVEGATCPRYLATKQLLYAKAGSIFAVPFDPKRLELTGEPVSVLNDVRMSIGGSGIANYDVSLTGSLIYVPGYPRPVNRTLVWVDRDGNTRPVTETRQHYDGVSISPDGSQLAVEILGPTLGQGDVWLYDLERQNWTRLTFDGASFQPLWTPDGNRVLFKSSQADNEGMMWILTDGSGQAEPLVTPWRGNLDSLSPDGSVIMVHAQQGPGLMDIWTLDFDGDPEPRSFLVTPFSEAQGVFSPDGRWVAYRSSESGSSEVYVRPYPGPGPKWPISKGGGRQSLWSRDGRELFYRSSGKVTVVPVQTEPEFRAGTPRVLFELPRMVESAYFRTYDISPDGQRFVMIQEPESSAEPLQLVIVPDWFEELKRLVPTN